MKRLGAACAGFGLALLVGCSLFGGVDDLKGGAASGGGAGNSAAGGVDGGGVGGSGGADGGGTGAADGGGATGGDSGSNCPPGKKDCGGACVDVSDPSTGCGGPSCDPCSLPHASPICVGGACVPSQCEIGYEDCNGDGSDGCEASLKTDGENCGTCFTNCALPHAQVSCLGGSCKFGGCDAGFSDCNGDPKDGCEVNVAADPDHCGSCGNACTAPVGKSAICDAGQCGVSNCASPLADCDQDPSGSCEVDLSSSLANCGFCGNVCSYANATASCNGGNCALAACTAGYTDCDGNPANGCETNTGASLQNCGACDKVCAGGANATATCSGGSCGLSCNAGYGNCNSSLGDGCETPLNTLQNCGACGKSISASGSANASSLCSIVGSGNTLQFTGTDPWGGCGQGAGSITLSGVTVSGSVNASSLCGVTGSGSSLQFTGTDPWGGCGQGAGSITLSGATASGSASLSTLCGVTGSGSSLQFTGTDPWGGCGQGAGSITLACKP